MSAASIPRFLLPQSSAIWRSRTISSFTSRTVRNASSKPRVLEKPARFNPPSHGAKLRKPGPRYAGPELSQEEVHAQSRKQYPNMMPPEGTFMHWFLHNKSIHVWITLGTLCSIATFTFITNFRRTSKFGHMIPPTSDLFYHPITFTRTYLQALRLHMAAISEEAAERRQRSKDDIAKRGAYRKAHGLETEEFGGWTAKGQNPALDPALAVEGESHTSAGEVANAEDGALQEHVESHLRERRPIKKWLGIW